MQNICIVCILAQGGGKIGLTRLFNAINGASASNLDEVYKSTLTASEKMSLAWQNVKVAGAELFAPMAEGVSEALDTVIVPTMQKASKAAAEFAKSKTWADIKTIISATFNAIKTVVQTVWPLISGIIKAAVKTIVATIHTISSVVSAVSSTFNKVKSAISGPINSAKEIVRSAVNSIRNMFPLSIGKIFTNLKLPHISVSSGSAPFGIGGKGSLPSFSVSWYAKAMQTPYVFQEATLFGAGEKGDEILYGRKALLDDIRDATSDRSVQITNYITVDGAENPEEFANRLVREMKLTMRTA